MCELRSVNHRFLEASLRLPDELRAAEGELRRASCQQLRRGKVDCTLNYRRAWSVPPRHWRSTGRRSSVCLPRCTWSRHDAAGRGGERARRAALARRGARGVPRPRSELLAAAYAVFGATLEELVAARAREGTRLRELLEQRCAGSKHWWRTCAHGCRRCTRACAHASTSAWRSSPPALDPERLEQELAILLQRLDVDEELERLGGHIAEVRRVITANEPAGRRLDFLMQELNREANTLSSKSQDLETTRSAVDMKVLIEQMREQVQNAE